MDVYSVDERDAREEMTADGYRVMIIRPGRRVSAYNIDAASVEEAMEWASGNSKDGAYSLAARFDTSGAGVTLMWLTQPPEIVMGRLDD